MDNLPCNVPHNYDTNGDQNEYPHSVLIKLSNRYLLKYVKC